MTTSSETAKTAIRGYKLKNYDVDANNPDHVKAYMEMRQWAKRVDGESFVNYLKNRKVDVSVGSKVKLPYWGVPKENFPLGLVASLLDSEVSDEKIAKMEMAGGGQVDTETYYILDMQAKRGLLGPDVRILECYCRSNARARVSGGSLTTGSARVSSISLTTGNIATPSNKLPPSPPTVLSERGLKRQRSDASEEDLPVHVKRATQQLDTLKALRDDILEAASKGAWNSDNPMNQRNVKFLFEELLACLKDITASKSESAQHLVDKFTKFANDKLLLSKPCFLHLKPLEQGIEELLEMGGEEKDMTQLILALTKVPAEGEELPNMGGAGVVTRTRFRNSTLFKNFAAERAGWYLIQARESEKEERRKWLNRCLDCGDLHPPTIVGQKGG